MAEFLSDAWFDAYVAATAARPEAAGADGTVLVTVEGAPDGRVWWVEELTAGRISSLTPGKGAADVELTAKYDVAVEVFGGEVDANVAFMRGDLKMSGDMNVWLPLLPALQSDDYRAALAATLDG